MMLQLYLFRSIARDSDTNTENFRRLCNERQMRAQAVQLAMKQSVAKVVVFDEGGEIVWKKIK